MKSVIFCFATHNHQPIGNFDHIIEEAYQHSYKPFFDLAAKHPIRFATHFTGILLDWIEAHHPEHIALLRSMVERGQLEVISGGFYEPILSVIPPADQQAQIHLLSEKIRTLYGYDATGMWLAERVWEQPLAAVLNDAGMRYVLLDDTHFLHAGLRAEDLLGYYVTEDRGKTIAVIPIGKALRYTIPFAPVDETIKVLRDASSESGSNLVAFADDGEKFGVWPGTYDSVYRRGWLVEFFRKLEENTSWITMLHPAEVIKRIKPIGRIYLPNASYSEMMQWALPTARSNASYENFVHKLDEDKKQWEEYRPFVRGGYWRNFLAKYPEVNHLHKHMLRTSERLADGERRVANGESASALIDEARTSLLSAQCNDPYWHGVFGGAYLPNLRHANYSALVKADALLDHVEGRSGARMKSVDIDCDGEDEVILESPIFSIYIKPSLSGMIAEIDFKPRHFNATNIISRQEEEYHRKIVEAGKKNDEKMGNSAGSKSIHDLTQSKEEGLEKLLVYDWYRRGSWIEHFLPESSTVEELRTNRYSEMGGFVNSSFDWSYDNDRSMLRLTRLGDVEFEDKLLPLRLTKSLKIEAGSNLLQIGYQLMNESVDELRLRFASEWTFNLLAGDAHDRFYESDDQKLAEPKMNSSGSIAGANLRLVDEYLRLAIDVRPREPREIVRYSIESVSLSESGFERVFQGSVVMPVWNIALSAGEEWTTSIVIEFETL